MRRLFLTLRSPYARKVAIALREKGLAYEPVVVDLANRSPEFAALGPIGKVPVLVDEDGTVVADSTVAVEYLEDRYRDRPLRGEGWRARLESRRLDELGDTLADNAVVGFMQRENAPARDRALATAERVLATLDEEVRLRGELAAPTSGPAFGIAQAAVVSALGYLGLRHGDGWRTRHPALAAWFDAQGDRESVRLTVPVA